MTFGLGDFRLWVILGEGLLGCVILRPIGREDFDHLVLREL